MDRLVVCCHCGLESAWILTRISTDIKTNFLRLIYPESFFQIFKSSMFPTFLKGFLAGECV